MHTELTKVLGWLVGYLLLVLLFAKLVRQARPVGDDRR